MSGIMILLKVEEGFKLSGLVCFRSLHWLLTVSCIIEVLTVLSFGEKYPECV